MSNLFDLLLFVVFVSKDGEVGWSEFYFKCSEHVTKGESDEAVALNLIRNNLHDIPCLACTDVR